MKPSFITGILILFYINVSAHPVFINIELQPISCQSYNYTIIVNTIYPEGSDILFGGFEVSFGDGVVIEFPRDDMEKTSISHGMTLFQKKFNHAFGGPGIYKIGARLFNRHANIVNMKNSANTPLYTETILLLDPIYSCNTTPHLENFTYPFFKNGHKYKLDLSIIDNEGDSLSFYLANAMQDRGIEVIDYSIPAAFEEPQIRRISKLVIDPYTGFHFWNTKNISGNYSLVIKVKEWRKIEGKNYQISESVIDYSTLLIETENNPPNIIGLKDTALIVGNNFINDIQMTDPEDDSLQMLIYGDFVRLLDNLPQNSYAYKKGPLDCSVNFQPKPQHVRSKPYKLLISGTDKNEDQSLNHTRSMYVWIANREHQPNPPTNMMAQAFNQNLVSIYWNDSNDELGYILERADLHFPEFEKIAILPANTTYFNDSSVVENNTYQYRIKAVGTTMSDYVTAKATTPDIVTSLIQDNSEHTTKIYPNPNSGTFTISAQQNFQSMKIIDITGKMVFAENLNQLPGSYEFSPKLNPGIYVMHLINESDSKQLKLEILR